MNKARNKAFKIIYQSAKETESKLTSKDYSIRAESLLTDSTNDSDYEKLIGEVVDFLTSCYGGESVEYYKQQIESLVKSITDKDSRNEALLWIAENMSSREDAFDLIRIEADDIYFEFLDWYFNQNYRRLRRTMLPPEKRIFQLLYFRREGFLGRIPIFEPLFMNFAFNSNNKTQSYLILKLIFKKSKFGGQNITNELMERWKSYLSIYPKIVDEQLDIFELLDNKEKLNKLLSDICTEDEIKIAKLFIRGVDPEIISIKTNIKPQEMMRLMTGVTTKIRRKVKNEGFKDA